MPKIQQDLIDLSTLAKPAGDVNCACRFDSLYGQNRGHQGMFYLIERDLDLLAQFQRQRGGQLYRNVRNTNKAGFSLFKSDSHRI
jgi:hypothetical protein